MRVTILDGGMGKELHRIGAPFRQPEWSAMALLEDPSFVRTAHDNFVAAGAELVITNTYAVIPYHLGPERFAAQGHELASLAGRIAREAADAAPHPVRVAGSLPPLFGSYAPSNFDAAAAPPQWRVLIEALDPWVDLWVGETIGSIAEFFSLADVLDDDGRPLWASFALSDSLDGDEPKLRTGETMAGIASAVADRCDAVLFNCSQPEVITAAIPRLARLVADSDLAFGAYANAFPLGATEDSDYDPNVVILHGREDLSPERYADFVGRWIDDGATIVGGCCEIYPQHIAELSARFG